MLDEIIEKVEKDLKREKRERLVLLSLKAEKLATMYREKARKELKKIMRGIYEEIDEEHRRLKSSLDSIIGERKKISFEIEDLLERERKLRREIDMVISRMKGNPYWKIYGSMIEEKIRRARRVSPSNSNSCDFLSDLKSLDRLVTAREKILKKIKDLQSHKNNMGKKIAEIEKMLSSLKEAKKEVYEVAKEDPLVKRYWGLHIHFKKKSKRLLETASSLEEESISLNTVKLTEIARIKLRDQASLAAWEKAVRLGNVE